MAKSATLPEIETENVLKRYHRYAVVLHNDDLNTYEFVVFVVQSVFNYPVEKCVQHMLEAHETGQSIVWVGTLELAELKADQIVAFGPDPRASKKAEPLRVTIEQVD